MIYEAGSFTMCKIASSSVMSCVEHAMSIVPIARGRRHFSTSNRANKPSSGR